MTFLEDVIHQALTRIPPDQLGQSLFLFPNKRAGLFFSRTLLRNPDRPDPMVMPETSTLAEWAYRHSRYQAASWETMVMTLFRCHRELAGDQAISFEQFYPNAKAILNDLMDLDRGLLSKAQIKELAQASQSSDNQSSAFFALVQQLPMLHELFNRSLMDQNLVHEALALRLILDDPSRLDTAMQDHTAVFACGFYPIDPAEIELFVRLKKNPGFHLLWDNDRYFTMQPDQEAGLLFKDSRLFYNEPDPGHSDIQDTDRHITLVETQGSVDQAKAMESILQEMASDESNGENTALILPQEALLLPLLSSIPAAYTRINITMGYPLAQTLPVTLLHNLQDLYRQIGVQTESVPFMPLYRLLKNPQWAPFLRPEVLADLQHDQEVQTRSVSLVKAQAWLHPFESLLDPPRTAHELFERLQNLMDTLKATLSDETAPDQTDPKLELLYQIRKQIGATSRFADSPDIPISIKTAWQLLWESLDQGAIPFSGEPLEGLQIMGMLESRCLDFKNLIIPSCNEGVFPRGRSAFSLIPHEIRQRYKLTCHRENDAREAYHFYRLLKRSRHVWLIYDGSGRGENGTEASRFIKQIEHELTIHCPRTHLHKQPRVHTPPQIRTTQIRIDNDIGLRQVWRQMTFSASAINTLLRCPLSFAYRYGLKIQEKSRSADETDPRGIGLIAHQCLEELYRPWVGKEIDRTVIHQMLPLIPSLVTRVSTEQYPGLNIRSGRPYLEGRILTELLNRFLAIQGQINPYLLYSVEQNLLGFLDLESGTRFKLKGFIDRIDRQNEIWRIVDYKSGTVGSSDLSIKKMPDEFTLQDPFNKKKFAWQLLIYQWLFCQSQGIRPDKVTCSLISLRNPNDGFLELNSSDKVLERHEQFSFILKGLFTVLDDPGFTFEQTDQADRCKTCPYLDICNR